MGTCYLLYEIIGECTLKSSGMDDHLWNALKLQDESYELSGILFDAIANQIEKCIAGQYQFSYLLPNSNNVYVEALSGEEWIPFSSNNVIYGKLLPLSCTSTGTTSEDFLLNTKKCIASKKNHKSLLRNGSTEKESSEKQKVILMNTDQLKKNAKDMAKNLSEYIPEDAKVLAKEKAKMAKKWTGSFLSTLSSSIAMASQSFLGESILFPNIGKVKVIKEINSGKFGQVFHVSSGERNMAMKRVLCPSMEILKDVQREVHVLKSVQHENIVPLYDSMEKDREVFLMMPCYSKNLAEVLQGDQWEEKRILKCFLGIAKGVQALHQMGWCHRDIKPENIVIDDVENPVLIDFGSCAPIHVNVATKLEAIQVVEDASSKSSMYYRPPELFKLQPPTMVDGQADVWSLGCLLYKMAFGASPFELKDQQFSKTNCLNGKVVLPNETYSEDFAELILDMLHPTPSERPSMFDVVEIAFEILK